MSTKCYRIMYHQVFYLIIHSVFTIFEIIYNLYRRLCHEFAPVININKRDKNSYKIPRHVTLLLGSEDPSYKDLTKFLVWCLTTGVSFISFYDHKGTLKKNEEKFYAMVQQSKPPADHVIWHENSDIAPRNGFLGRKIHVKVFSSEDGRRGVVDLTKKLIKGGQTDFSVDNVDQIYHKQFEFPDPDLGVYCGDAFSLYGYPPWQIRVTEFLQIDSHHDITINQCNRLLARFNSCEQRLGK